MTGDSRWWHGGAPGRRPGDLLLPPTVTGTSRALTVTALDSGVDPALVRADRVHLTTDRAVARAYAACVRWAERGMRWLDVLARPR